MKLINDNIKIKVITFAKCRNGIAQDSENSTFGLAALVTLVAALVSGLAVRGRLDRLDLIAVLKSRE